MIIGAAAALLLPLPEAVARTRKGDKLLMEGRKAEAAKEYDKALSLYEQALADDPSDAGYMMATYRVRFQAGQLHLDRGQKLRQEGKLEEALAEFQRGYAIDPSSSLAVQELKRTFRMIEERKKAGSGKQPGDEPLTPSARALQQEQERISAILPAPELKPISPRVNTLKMNNQPVKVLFETLGKLAGINVVFDPEYQTTGKNYSIDLTNVSLEQGLEHIAVLTKSFWKPISPNTIFITNDNVTKRRDYEDMVVKAFYLKNITAPQELQEISTVVRSITDIRRVFTYNAQSVVVVRGTVDQVRLAEKIIQDLDKPKSEVVVDVYVMEANSSRTRDLAATIASGGKPGLQLPIGFTPRSSLAIPGSSAGGDNDSGGTGLSSTTGSSSSAVRLSNIGNITTEDFSLTLPGALLQALMSDRGTRILQSPQLRTADSQKASLKIGDRFPYATGSFQPGVGTVGISPLVSTQFQFADVGVNVDLTPKIHGPDEVSMHVEIDISNVRERIDVGGLSQPVIGQRKLVHDVRLREGEVSLIGGLMQDQDTKTVSGVPGLGSIPLIRRLFTSENVEKSRGELLIALVPHVVRAPDLTDLNLRGVAAGTDQQVKLSYAPRAVEAPPATLAESAKEVVEAAPSADKDAPAAPAKPPSSAPSPADPARVEPPAEPPAPPPAAAASGVTRLSFLPANVQTAPGGLVVATLQVEGAKDLFSMPMKLKFDPKLLRLNEVARGNLMSAGGQQPIFTRNINNDAGEVSIILNRLPGSTGVSGSGAAIALTFQAIGRGSTTVGFQELSVRNSQMQPIPVDPPTLTVVVQ